MLHSFNLYDLFVLCFVQLVLSTILVLSPAQRVGTRFRWTGSRVTEVIVGALAAAAVSALACFFTADCGGCPSPAWRRPLTCSPSSAIVVIVLRPDTNVVGQVFYASYAAAGFTFLAFAALVAGRATRSYRRGADGVAAASSSTWRRSWCGTRTSTT